MRRILSAALLYVAVAGIADAAPTQQRGLFHSLTEDGIVLGVRTKAAVLTKYERYMQYVRVTDPKRIGPKTIYKDRAYQTYTVDPAIPSDLVEALLGRDVVFQLGLVGGQRKIVKLKKAVSS